LPQSSTLGLKEMNILSLLVNGVLALALAAGVLFGVLCVRLARLPYNSEGRYFDGVVVTHESAPLALGVLCVVSFVVAGLAFLLRRFLARKRRA